jgi:hypothetical protein
MKVELRLDNKPFVYLCKPMQLGLGCKFILPHARRQCHKAQHEKSKFKNSSHPQKPSHHYCYSAARAIKHDLLVAAIDS